MIKRTIPGRTDKGAAYIAKASDRATYDRSPITDALDDRQPLDGDFHQGRFDRASLGMQEIPLGRSGQRIKQANGMDNVRGAGPLGDDRARNFDSSLRGSRPFGGGPNNYRYAVDPHSDRDDDAAYFDDTTPHRPHYPGGMHHDGHQDSQEAHQRPLSHSGLFGTLRHTVAPHESVSGFNGPSDDDWS